MSNKKDTKKNLVFKNRKAFHDFTILETLEAGIMLEGSEVKAIRDGRINLKDSFVPTLGLLCFAKSGITSIIPANATNKNTSTAKKNGLCSNQ